MREAALASYSPLLEYLTAPVSQSPLEQNDSVTMPTTLKPFRSQFYDHSFNRSVWCGDSLTHQDVSRKDIDCQTQTTCEADKNTSFQETIQSSSNADQPAQDSSNEVHLDDPPNSAGDVQDNTVTPAPEVAVVTQKTPVCVRGAADQDSTERPEVPTCPVIDTTEPKPCKTRLEKLVELIKEAERLRWLIQRLSEYFSRLDLVYETELQPTKPSIFQWRQSTFSCTTLPDHLFFAQPKLLDSSISRSSGNSARIYYLAEKCPSNGYSFSGVNPDCRQSRGSRGSQRRDRSVRGSRNEDMDADFVYCGPNESTLFHEPTQVQSTMDMDGVFICSELKPGEKFDLDLENDLPYDQPPHPLDAPPPRLSVPCQNVPYNPETTCLVSGFDKDCTHTSSKQEMNTHSSNSKKPGVQELAGFISDSYVVSKNMHTPVSCSSNGVAQLNPHTELLALPVEASVLSYPRSLTHAQPIVINGVVWFNESEFLEVPSLELC